MGALSALALADLGIASAWYAPKEEARSDGAQSRNYALSPGSVQLLQKLGLWNALAPKTCTVTRMEVFAGSSRLDLSATDAGTDFLSIMVLHQDLLDALEQAVQYRPTVGRVFSKPDLLETHSDCIAITTNSDTRKVQLVIGADGQKSWVRQQSKILWGQRDYGQQGVVAAFKSEHAHSGVAAQWFTPKGILALLPLADSHELSMVWSKSPNNISASRLTESLAEEISELSENRFGRLELISSIQAAPLKMMLTEKQIGERVVLIGDSAHTVHPLAGYGLNLGIQDLLCLIGIFESGHQDLGALALLNQFEKERHFKVKRVQWALDLLQRFVNQSHPAVQRIRSMGLELVSEIGPLRQFLIRQAISPQ